MNNDLISREALKKAFEDCTGECACCIHNTNDFKYCGLIDDAPTVETFNLEDMQNNYDLGAMHENGKHDRPKGEWARHDEWRNGEYIGGFYHVNCPIEDGYYSKWRTNFCPNCGQPMMKEGAE